MRLVKAALLAASALGIAFAGSALAANTNKGNTAAPGQANTSPGQAGTSPGQLGTTPGQTTGTLPPGQNPTFTPPGQTFNTPGKKK